MHNKLRRVHGDLKPDNLALDRDSRILINDLGTSTCTSIGKSISPRDNMGFIYTRSYKSFKEGEHPTKADDVFGIGSLTYRLFTGKYLFEDEINKSIDPKLFFEQLGQKGVEELLKKKLKKIPRNLRKFVKKCTEYNSWNRYQSGFEAQISLEKIIKRTSENDSYKRYLKRSVPYVVTSTLLGYLAYGIATFEPTKIDLPIQQGQYISLDHLPKENPVIFIDFFRKKLQPNKIQKWPRLSLSSLRRVARREVPARRTTPSSTPSSTRSTRTPRRASSSPPSPSRS